LLAGLGADVVKVEPPEGDPTRRLPPFAGDEPGRDRSLPFLHLNRAKRSIVLDRTDASDRARLLALASTADALVLDGPAEDALAEWGTGVEALRELRPELVVASLVGFGGPGPWSDWQAEDLVLSAAAGIAACTGEGDRAPLKVGGYICLVAHGQTAAAATLSALFQVRRGGPASSVEVAGAEASADLLEMWATGAYQGRPMPRQGRHHNSNYPFEVYPCRDGLVGVHAGPGPWSAFEELVGSPELTAISVAEERGNRMQLRPLLDPILVQWLAERNKIETYHAGQARRQAFGYVATVEDLVNSPQLLDRGFFVRLEHPEVPDALYAGAPFQMSGGWRHERAPLLGEHTDDVLSELATVEGPGAPKQAVTPPHLPLEGVRVLDLTQIWAGPRAVKVLTDYGADVIKVESPARTDGTRGYARFRALTNGDPGSERAFYQGTQFEQLHRGQRSLVVDLRSESGKQAFDELIAASDIIVANFSYGVLARLGLDWAQLATLNPRAILLSMTAFGDSGPERDYVAYGVTQEELSGIYSLTGYPDGEPLKSGSNIGDPMNGMHGAVALLAALVERERTGAGQYIELSQLESTIPFIGEVILDFTVNGRVASPTGNAHVAWSPHGIYPARGDDEWVAIVARDDAEWSALLGVLGGGDLADDLRFASEADRLAHRSELDNALAGLTASMDRTLLAEALQAVGVPAAPVLNSVEVQHHPHYLARDYVQVHPYPSGGDYRYFGPLWRIDGQRPQIRGVAPLLGEHTSELLAQFTSVEASALERA
jgi:crotonobetainyl-CoA:carnitine CoA-transferase CaiB-like acyl-CoA transferase